MTATRRFRRLALAAVLAGAAAARGAAAQASAAEPLPPPAGSAAPSAEDAFLCRGGTISQVFVDNNSVFVVGDPDLDPRFNWAYRLANRLHMRTREGVIRRELLFREGSCYRPAQLEDSERILRALPFIADADVFALRQPDSTWHVVVETRDEWSTRLEPQLESGGAALTGLELREENLLGRGQRVSAFYKEYQGQHVYGAAVGTRQLLGTHLDADLSLARTPVGLSLQQRLAWPFRGENGRFAARQQFEHVERNFEYFVRDAAGGLERRFFAEERTGFDAGVVMRLGRRGSLTLVGAALVGEFIAYPRDSLAAPDDPEAVPLPGGGQVAGLDSISTVRLMFLLGQRNVYFERRRALDAVRGAEDVRLGLEAELGLGRSLGALSDGDDLALELGLAAAGDLRGVLAGSRLVLEAKRDLGGGSRGWRDLFGQVDAWAYWRPGEESSHTFVLAARAAGGWETTVPFQLTAGHRAGLRGFPRHVYAGERRVVGTLEHRAYLGWPYPRLFDLGTALFVDAGRTWAGGDPFGEDSPLLLSVGGGFRIAFPPGSRQTYRLDVAFPVAPDFRPGGLQISFGVGQAVGRGTLGDDPQLARSSRRSISASLFSFPN
ncbi:MAG TPA: hypothetical protein VF746_02880 [Longimicrobium sp.]|jgi:hypothetical protein